MSRPNEETLGWVDKASVLNLSFGAHGAKDYSNNHFTVNIGGSVPIFNNNGKETSVFVGDNSNYLEINDNIAWSLPKTCSIILWVTIANVSSKVAISRGDIAQGFFIVEHNIAHANNYNAFFDASNGFPSPATTTINDTDLNIWKFLVVTYDGTNVILYRNGIQVDSKSYTGNVDNFAGPLKIGQYVSTTSYPWNGNIAYASILKRTLSAIEIRNMFEAGI